MTGQHAQPMTEPSVPLVVILMVRVPIPGQVKTRLARTIGAGAACDLYQAMVRDILASVRASGLPLMLCHDGLDAAMLPKQWTQAAAHVFPQVHGDIGRRMATACAHCFDQGCDRVLLAGSDLPDLDAGVLALAARGLEDHETVLVPTLDGGYGLVGLQRQRYCPELFQNVAWSTDQVLAQTLRQLHRFGLSVDLLPPLRDIDTIADLLAWCRDQGHRPSALHQALADLRHARKLPENCIIPSPPPLLENPS